MRASSRCPFAHGWPVHDSAAYCARCGPSQRRGRGKSNPDQKRGSMLKPPIQDNQCLRSSGRSPTSNARPNIINQRLRPAKEIRQIAHTQMPIVITCVGRPGEVSRAKSRPRHSLILIDDTICSDRRRGMLGLTLESPNDTASELTIEAICSSISAHTHT